ncbi:hypothetical protein Asppvi_010419 [Aspergillus pseudoviridinutans]|uniref:Uncharacterized protein n=1 Tax=Aspergillus pseudoviridinutans TaxID=1517512 RepID=A0A9P3BPC8_9EURO|nr:uncharacterized protein Asppvi_010419 [Aspergillus pseudoviridinutans]GIJ91454.1 hypothetical protein Asppvi_010419 [Aspergillus pseudoviridinutans]
MAPTARKLSRETLQRNGIVIEMEISEDGWPDGIAQIRDRILSFDRIIPPKKVEFTLCTSELDEYDYTTSEDEDYEPESSEEEDDSSDGSDGTKGSLEDDEDLDSESYKELTPSRGYRHKEGVDVTGAEDLDRTGASNIETGTSRKNSNNDKLICYPWAVVEVKRPSASRQDIE